MSVLRAADLDGPRPRRSRAGGRSNLLFVLPIPFLWRGFFAEPLGLLANLTAFGLLVAAAWLTREGLLAEDAYASRDVARRPALPRKMMGSVLLGAGLAAAGLWNFGGPLAALVPALLGTALHLAAFGPDPLRDKAAPGTPPEGAGRVADAVAEAETHLAAMTRMIRTVGDPALVQRVERFTRTARGLFREVERDPRDLTGARRYLGVYLEGAAAATAKYAALEPGRRGGDARADYLALLDDLQSSFAARTERMVAGEQLDLAVEIEVLRDRLAREGVGRE